jgi:hypothetical protein
MGLYIGYNSYTPSTVYGGGGSIQLSLDSISNYDPTQGIFFVWKAGADHAPYNGRMGVVMSKQTTFGDPDFDADVKWSTENSVGVGWNEVDHEYVEDDRTYVAQGSKGYSFFDFGDVGPTITGEIVGISVVPIAEPDTYPGAPTATYKLYRSSLLTVDEATPTNMETVSAEAPATIDYASAQSLWFSFKKWNHTGVSDSRSYPREQAWKSIRIMQYKPV